MQSPDRWWEDVPQTGMRLTYHTPADIAGLRQEAAEYAQSAGMAGDRVPFVRLAVSELASNTLRHSSGPGTLCLWCDGDSLFVQVSDQGELPEATAVSPPPFPPKNAAGGYGLALAGKFSDDMVIHPKPAVIRLRLRLK